MKLVEVSPISSRVAKDTLTYFSSKEVFPGDIVAIEVRKKIYDALVLNVRPAKDLKTDIKRATFGFKKILEIRGKFPVYEEFLKAVSNTNKFFIGNLGQTLSTLLPKSFMENLGSFPYPKKRKIQGSNLIWSLDGPREHRITFYKKYIQESFEEKKSILICLPTIDEARTWSLEFKKDFKNTFLFYGNMAEKKFIKQYTDCINEENPVLIISTPTGLFIPRHDLNTLILENESSLNYKTIRRPYFDIKTLATFLHKSLKYDLILADTILSLETIAARAEKKIKSLVPPNFELKHLVKQKFVDMNKKENKAKSFIFSEDTLKLINEAVEKKESIFLYTLRKGLATQIVCHDCKNVVTDKNIPVTLFKDENTGNFIMRNAVTRDVIDPKLRCEKCGSWNFDSLGIGTDTVFEETKKYFPKAKIFQVDAEKTKTKGKTKDRMFEFEDTRGSILIGTEMALGKINTKIDNTIIVSLDSLFNIPSYKIHEKILHLILSLIERTSKKILVQTRNFDNELIESLRHKNLKDFFDSEMEQRKKFKYPPFTTIIKISHSQNINKLSQDKTFFEKLLEKWGPQIKISREGSAIKTTAVLRLEKSLWNEGDISESSVLDRAIFETLGSLSPDYEIRVNPEKLF